MVRRCCVCAVALLLPAVAWGQALEGRALDNLVAFTRLLGYVRYFHPSDEAAAANWGEFAVEGVRAVEGATSAAELAQTLEALVRPMAPTVRVFPTGQQPPPIPPQAPAPQIVAWRHRGVGTGNRNSIYSSERITNKGPERQRFGNLMQAVDAAPYRGRRVRFRAAVRAEVSGSGNQAQLWLRVDRKGGAVGFFDNMQDRPIVAGDWRDYEIEGDIAEDAERISFGMILVGEGRAWLDAVSFEVVGEAGPAAPASGQNLDFEEGEISQTPAGWLAPGSFAKTGYSVRLSDDHPKSGKRCAIIASEKMAAEALPDPAKPYAADLGGGVSCLVPLALYSDRTPRATASERTEAAFSGNDRATRLAVVALAWNVFQHFYPYFDVVETDWGAALRRALTAAATDPDERAFLDTLRRLVAELHDGHGNVFHRSEAAPYIPPFLWGWIEGRLVVTQVAPEGEGGLQPGDVVLRVDGHPAAEALADKERLISGATPQWRRFHAVRTLLAGAQDSEIALELRDRTGKQRSITARRSLPLKELQEARPLRFEELHPGIFYVDLNSITDSEFNTALPKLEQARGIVFDLRGYPRVSPSTIGHLIDKPVTCAQWHVPVVTYPDREKTSFEFSNWTVSPRSPRLKARIAFLTDGRAISYAETYLGIIEHYKLAEIVGEPTAGTNGNVNPFTLPGGYRVSWTGMKVLKHDGSRHHGAGIQPTIRVSRTIRGVIEGRDELLERAIEILKTDN